MNVKKVIQLDILSVKPYFTLKNLVLLIVLSIVYAALTKNPILVVSMTQLFALLFSGYPFMVGEEAGIDPLYKIFSIKGNEVVAGRYLISILFVVWMLIAGVCLGYIVSLFYPMGNFLNSVVYVLPVTFFITTIIIFMEYPIYFKFGYKKGKTLASVPFFALGILILTLNFFELKVKELTEFIVNNSIMALGFFFLLWIIVLMISFSLSKKFYLGRDF